MHLLIGILACVLAGWLTGLVMKGRGYGLIGDLLLGIVGGWVGWFIFGRFFLGGGLFGSILIRMLGAIALVAIVRLLRKV